jgi:hypothetical protein
MNDSRYFGQGANGINFATVRDNTGIADFYFDSNIAGNMTDQDSAIVFAPGSLLYLPYLQYVGNYGKIGTMERFTMPIPGLPSVRADIRVLPDSCDETYAIWMECFFDLYSAPTAMFPAGDPNDGVNGVFKAQFVAGV